MFVSLTTLFGIITATGFPPLVVRSVGDRGLLLWSLINPLVYPSSAETQSISQSVTTSGEFVVMCTGRLE